MKYLKSFENIDIINEKSHEYEKISIDHPFFILATFKINKVEYMSMCKLLNIDGNYINWEEYDYDDFEKGYQVINRSIDINDFDKYYSVLKTFKTFKEMKTDFNIILTSNKYNL